VPSSSLVVVLVHCAEPLSAVIRTLRAMGVRYVIMHKSVRRCSRSGIRQEVEAGGAGELVEMPHNLGRECSGYLRFIVDRYESLPPMTAFLQAGAQMHMPFDKGSLWPSLRPLVNGTRALSYVGLSKNSFEGRWPAPCETRRNRVAFDACHRRYWSELAASGPEAGNPPPTDFRFYANGLFAVSARRIRRHPRNLYVRLLARLEGRAPLLCVNPKDPHQAAYAPWAGNGSERSFAPAEIDCLMLEKLWHVLFGEPSTMPPPDEYNHGGRYTEADLQWAASQGSRLRSGRIQCS